ncbi:MAG: hypothetical protein ACPG47_04670, partial [Leucothrix sp.]
MTYLNTAAVSEALHNKQRLAVHDAQQQLAMSKPFTNNYVSPTLVMSEQRLRRNAQRFMAAMPRVRPHFAVKANPDTAVLTTFKQAGTGFEIASMAEIDLLHNLGVDLTTVFYSNPIKSVASIKYAAAKGITWYCVDTPEEIQKIAAIKPDAKLYLRIEVSNEGASWPLADKFGASGDAINTLIHTAKQLAMQLAGVTFHVGSQCTHIDNWI